MERMMNNSRASHIAVSAERQKVAADAARASGLESMCVQWASGALIWRVSPPMLISGLMDSVLARSLALFSQNKDFNTARPSALHVYNSGIPLTFSQQRPRVRACKQPDGAREMRETLSQSAGLHPCAL